MDLTGIHAKLHRAERHIKELTNDMDELCTEVRQSIVREVCEDSDKQIWIYRGETPNAPIEWSVTLGEILYNLRSSLDHLVWQLVLANGQTPGRHNEFPITTDDQSWQQVKGRTLRGVSNRYEAMIGDLQPYTGTGGTSPAWDVSMLKVLKDLDNVEKHRHLILGVIVSKGIQPLDSQLDDSDTRPPLKGSTGRIETGRVLLELNNAGMDIVPSFEVDVGLANIGLHGRTLPHILVKCLRTVKGCVEFLTTPMGWGFVEAPRKP